MSRRALMLVSATVDSNLRAAVAGRHRPRPEYLILESEHSVDLLDWSQTPGPRRRTGIQIGAQVATALRRSHGYEVLFADGEHVGIPLAAAMALKKNPLPLLAIGHHLTTRHKRTALRASLIRRRMTRILVHSPLQERFAVCELQTAPGQVALVGYGADAEFWRPLAYDEEAVIVTAGREHRDFATLAAACGDFPERVHVAAGSIHSPHSTSRNPATWPANFDVGFADYATLRDMYARAKVVVVPVVETDFQAGVTTILEAMAMGKAVVATATSGRAETITDGETGILVPSGDATALKDAIRDLLANKVKRRRLGIAARDAVMALYSVETYAATLAEHLDDLAGKSSGSSQTAGPALLHA